MRLTLAEEDRIVAEVTHCFRTFGGGRGSEWNPVAQALKDSAPSFAAGVDVRDVVRFVLTNATRRPKGRRGTTARKKPFVATRA